MQSGTHVPRVQPIAATGQDIVARLERAERILRELGHSDEADAIAIVRAGRTRSNEDRP